MQVKLVSHTPDPEKAIIEAAAVSYRSKPREEILDHIIKAGHWTPLEFATFNFEISGISRACSHQLVRKRVGVAFVQESQRYVSYEKDFNYVTPPKIGWPKEVVTYFEDNPKKIFEKAMAAAQTAYGELLKLGIPAEDARFVLPNACATTIAMSVNYHALLDLAKERLCKKAQWEIRELMRMIKKEVLAVSPRLSSYMQPKCKWLGGCPEKKPCEWIRWSKGGEQD